MVDQFIDGDRIWLVDWEAAFLNDRYADLAVVANLFVHSEEDEQVFLQEYLGRPPAVADARDNTAER